MKHVLQFTWLLICGVGLIFSCYNTFHCVRMWLGLGRIMKLRQQREEVFARFMQAYRDEDRNTCVHWAAEHQRLAVQELNEIEKV